jgi:bifunctional aspartokinase / homoserine dehydrogenase 1
MKVLKFGGSSVANADRIKNVLKIVSNSHQKNRNIAVVFSAFQGVTDELLNISSTSALGNISYQENLKELEKKHLNIAKELISVKRQSKILSSLKLNFNELEDILHGVYLIKELSPRTSDFIVSFGERLSAFIIAEALIDRKIEAEFLDSRMVLITDNNFGGARVNFNLTNEKIKRYFKNNLKLQIITGFIASTINNETTTLGRGGSDYTASIFGAALSAKEIEIWTDVDGVLTADPRKVKNAFSLKGISYEEAMELSHFGAKVIHPPTMQPALNKKIPIRIKNTFNPSFPGTVIGNRIHDNKFSVKGFSSIDNIALLRIEGSGMVGVTGVAQRIFSSLAQKSINIILITQASSEHSLCLAVLPHYASIAKQLIEEEFKYEIKDKIIDEVLIENDLSIIAVVGENMRHTPGIAGKIFNALGRNGINIVAIAQGSSELNISTVIPKVHENKALNALHDSLFLSKEKSINLYVAGCGLIGGTLLNQINSQSNYLAEQIGLDLKVIGLTNSRQMNFDKNGIDLSLWKENLFSSNEKADINKFISNIKTLNLPNSIFVDCTASDEVVDKYIDILSSNISIATPNKKANSSDYEFYKIIRMTAAKHNVKFLYETNVGAGLPIIGTLKDLISSGDKVSKIEGILSGTLSYIFNSFVEGKKFSDVVLEAKDKGYTEPDPREDLRGTDVARKLLVLARELGIGLELADVKVESLIPSSANNAKNVEDFFAVLKKHDDEFDKLRNKAAKENKVLRYIARLEKGKAKISLEAIGNDHPFYFLTGSDNVVAFSTLYSQSNPIVVKGPGAGADVTAGGVFADIIRASQFLS